MHATADSTGSRLRRRLQMQPHHRGELGGEGDEGAEKLPSITAPPSWQKTHRLVGAMEDSEDERHDDSDSAEPMPLREALIRDLLSSGCTSELKMQPAALTLSSILIRAFIQ